MLDKDDFSNKVKKKISRIFMLSLKLQYKTNMGLLYAFISFSIM